MGTCRAWNNTADAGSLSFSLLLWLIWGCLWYVSGSITGELLLLLRVRMGFIIIYIPVAAGALF